MKYYKTYLNRLLNTSAILVSIGLIISLFSGLIYLSWLTATTNKKAFNIIFGLIISAAFLFFAASYILKMHKKGKLIYSLLNIMNILISLFILTIAVFLLPTYSQGIGILLLIVSAILFFSFKAIIKKLEKNDKI